MNTIEHLIALTNAFGPHDGITLTRDSWAKLHSAITEAVAELAEQKRQSDLQMNSAIKFCTERNEARAELATITIDRDEWKDATISANGRFKRAEAELAALKEQS